MMDSTIEELLTGGRVIDIFCASLVRRLRARERVYTAISVPTEPGTK
jgi:hypothetical protein